MDEWPTEKDNVYGCIGKNKWGIIGKGNDEKIVKNREFLVGPYLCNNGHWVMAYRIYKEPTCPICDQNKKQNP